MPAHAQYLSQSCKYSRGCSTTQGFHMVPPHRVAQFSATSGQSWPKPGTLWSMPGRVCSMLPALWPMLAEIGTNSAGFGPTLDKPNQRFLSKWADVGRNLVECAPHLLDFGPKLVDPEFGRVPKSAKNGKPETHVGRNRGPTSGRNEAKLEYHRLNFTKPGRCWGRPQSPNVGELWPTSDQLQSKSPKFGRLQATNGRNKAKFERHYTYLAEIGPNASTPTNLKTSSPNAWPHDLNFF